MLPNNASARNVWSEDLKLLLEFTGTGNICRCFRRFPDGSLRGRFYGQKWETFKDGVAYGVKKRVNRRWSKTYHPTGELHELDVPAEGVAYRDEGHGGSFKRTRYFKDGKVEFTGDWVEGRRHGRHVEYNQFGRILKEEFYHHDTELPRYIFETPESLTAEEILGERNAEVRRAMMELQGGDLFLDRAVKAGKAEVVDQDPDPKVGTLYRIMLGSSFAKFIKVKDGTMDKHYVLRVPPGMVRAKQANAWTWGLQEGQYQPTVER
jgi:hypothetical protein